MQVKNFLFALLYVATPLSQSFARSNIVVSSVDSTSSFHFTKNIGQVVDQLMRPRIDVDVKLTTDKGFSMFIGKTQLHYQWMKQVDDKNKDAVLINSYRMDVRLLNANQNAKLVSEKQQAFKEQFYGSYSASNQIAASYQKLTYKDIYPNIDWILYIKDNKMVYDFIVHPGGKVSDIQIQYGGATALNLNEDGSLSAITPMGSIGEQAPVSYTQEGKAVGSRFVLHNDILSFDVADYTGTLVIDPTLDWATYYGGLGKEYSDAITVDKWGNTYTSGYTLGLDNIATTGAYQTTFGGSDITNNAGDAFIAKYNCAGEKLWSTYYGGEAAERGWNVVADDYGHVYMAGFTNLLSGLPSTDNLATSGSYQSSPGGGNGDLFLVKFDSSGSRIWATYYGGTGNENSPTLPAGLALDHNGHVYLAGTTNSTNGIASTSAYQVTLAGSNDAFLVQFDTAGNRQWATYYGGTGNDRSDAITCDASGNIYLTGITTSTTAIATTGSYQTSFGGGNDGFLVKFNPSGARLWATYYGGTGSADEGMSLYTDTALNVYLAGRTNSTTGIASTGALQTTYGGGLYDAFLAKFDSSGSRQWGTYFGGINNGSIQGYNALNGDQNGHIFMVGIAKGTDSLATPGSYQEVEAGAEDAWLAKLEPGGTLDWATYYGGAGSDLVSAVRADAFGNIYLTGGTTSDANFATPGSSQSALGGDYDGFLIKFSEGGFYPGVDSIIGNTTVCATSVQTYHVPPVTGAIAYNWILPSGWSGAGSTDSIVLTAGTTSGNLIVYPIFPCANGTADTLAVEVIHATITALDTATCTGDTLLLTGTIANDLNWQWMQNDVLLPLMTDSTLQVYQSGNYQVIIEKGSCVDTSQAVTITVHPLPLVDIALVNGNLVATPGYNSYQWFHENVLIQGAVSQIYQPMVDGNYTVSVTDSNGCTATSSPLNYSSGNGTGISSVPLNDQIKIYPNPATDLLYISAPFLVKADVGAMDGRILIQADKTNRIDIQTLSEGMYWLMLYDSNGILISASKFIKSAAH